MFKKWSNKNIDEKVNTIFVGGIIVGLGLIVAGHLKKK